LGGAITVTRSNNTTISDSTLFSNLNYGIAVNNSSNSTKFVNIRTYNNSLDLKVNLNTSGVDLNLTNFAFDNPSGVSANVSNISLYLVTSSSDTRFSLNWSGDPSGGSLPSSRTSISNKYVNLSNNTSISLSSFVFNYASEPTDESALEIWSFNGSSWSQASSTVSTSLNTVTISSLSTSGILGLFEGPSSSSSGSSSSSSSSSSSDRTPSYSVSHDSDCPNILTIRRGGSVSSDVFVAIVQNGFEVSSGRTDSRGRFSYNSSSTDPIYVRLGSSTYFGPYSPSICRSSETTVQNTTVQNESIEPEIQEPQVDDSDDDSSTPISSGTSTQTNTSTQNSTSPDSRPTNQGSSAGSSQSSSTGSQSTNSSGATATSQNNNGAAFGLLGVGIVLLLILGAGAYWFFARRR